MRHLGTCVYDLKDPPWQVYNVLRNAALRQTAELWLEEHAEAALWRKWFNAYLVENEADMDKVEDLVLDLKCTNSVLVGRRTFLLVMFDELFYFIPRHLSESRGSLRRISFDPDTYFLD